METNLQSNRYLITKGQIYQRLGSFTNEDISFFWAKDPNQARCCSEAGQHMECVVEREL